MELPTTYSPPIQVLRSMITFMSKTANTSQTLNKKSDNNVIRLQPNCTKKKKRKKKTRINIRKKPFIFSDDQVLEAMNVCCMSPYLFRSRNDQKTEAEKIPKVRPWYEYVPFRAHTHGYNDAVFGRAQYLKSIALIQNLDLVHRQWSLYHHIHGGQRCRQN